MSNPIFDSSGIITNELGIIRHIAFYNKEFMNTHQDIVVKKKSDSPDEDKSVHDAAFDSAEIYKSLLTGDTFGKQKHFSKVYIPLNARAGLENTDYSINANGVPCTTSTCGRMVY